MPNKVKQDRLNDISLATTDSSLSRTKDSNSSRSNDSLQLRRRNTIPGLQATLTSDEAPLLRQRDSFTFACNRPLAEWNERPDSSVIASAVLDWPTHHSDTRNFLGESCRIDHHKSLQGQIGELIPLIDNILYNIYRYIEDHERPYRSHVGRGILGRHQCEKQVTPPLQECRRRAQAEGTSTGGLKKRYEFVTT